MRAIQNSVRAVREASIGVALWALVLLAFVFAAGIHASSAPVPAGSGDDAKKFEVVVDNFSFSPATLTVPVGATVTWTNRDDVPHTIVNTDGKFKSAALDTDEKFSFTFSAVGTYDYYCSVHPKMTGKVIVK